MSAKPLTGRKVFLIFASAFGVIIAVNVLLAVKAVGTFPGLEVKNSYVASQTFDAERAAQQALGWDVTAEVVDGSLVLIILGQDGVSVQPAVLEATLGRATVRDQDFAPDFAYDGRAYVAPVDLEPGKWDLRMTATAEDGTAFRQRIVMHVD
ncbi:FixH family protein [Pseudoruegeria sp. HB172150]|uniref:FixH family protein n=1 Tax=Pseudoruegeria sp. HB172150 TaxID=2721164 RepID=UPI0015530849|nr:FixH family protein [Pseudoruegeria sp. HB172150]